MERLATHNLDNTPPDQVGMRASLRPAEPRAFCGPSLPGILFPVEGGSSVAPCTAKASWGFPNASPLFSGMNEYSRPLAGTGIPRLTRSGARGDFSALVGRPLPHGVSDRVPQQNYPRKSCQGGFQLNTMAGSPNYCGAIGSRTMTGNRAMPSGQHASRRFFPAGLGPATHVLNGKARSVTEPFFTLGCRD